LVGDAARRGRGAVSRRARGEARSQAAEEDGVAAVDPARPGRPHRVLPTLQNGQFRDGMPDLDGERIPERACSATGRTGSCGEAGNLVTYERNRGGASPAAALLPGDASGPAQPAGVVAPPATLGFLLCAGLAVALAPRAPVAYWFSTGQWAPHGEGLHPSFLGQTRALVGEAA